MDEILKLANQYTSLINFALFGVILGFLIRISVQSRTALLDKHSSDLAAKDAQIATLAGEIASLKFRIESKDENHSAKLDVLNHQLAFFQKLAALPEDQRVLAIKMEYEEKIHKLEGAIARQEVPAEHGQQQISELREEEAKVVSKIGALAVEKLMELLPTLVRLAF